MSDEASLLSSAQDYVAWDPCEQTRAEVRAALEARDLPALRRLLGQRLLFGTAGLRGPMGAGYNAMNYLVIIQTTQGVIEYLRQTVGEEVAKKQGVVIGYDHRRLGDLHSKGFGELCARVFEAAGFKVYLYEDIVATPMVPFGVKVFGAAAGIMVTASHNPKRDDGYKLYWGNGVQIIPPHDSGTFASILKNLAPWRDYSTVSLPENSFDGGLNLRQHIQKLYMDELHGAFHAHGYAYPTSSRNIAYTAMHGVGREWIQVAFDRFGLTPQLSVVPQQAQPDPEFPTVSFPNPEEKGALNVAMQFADEHGCEVVIANDPDADRLGAAEKRRDGSGWKVISGNEIGIMLGHFQITKHKARAAAENRSVAVLASVVSSRMLQAIAKAEGAVYSDTLTGFKWLGTGAIHLQSEGHEVLFAYEEALGYCVGSIVHDKDGVSGAIAFMDMVNTLHARGMTLNDYLESLYAQYGQFQSHNSYAICHDPVVIRAVFERLRSCGSSPHLGTYIDRSGSVAITSIRDITLGVDLNVAPGTASLPATPDSEMLMFAFENGCTVTLRTSGTEPKIKYYIEMGGRPGMTHEDVASELAIFAKNVVHDLLRPDLHKLE